MDNSSSQNQWNKYADLYNTGIGKDGDELHKRYINPIISNFIGKIKCLKILDAACGNGYLLKTLSNDAEEVIGLDSSEELLEFARKNNDSDKISFLNADLLGNLPFENNFFDIIIANMVVQYLPSLETFAKESARILKPNGKLIIIIDSPLHALFLRAQELIGKKNDKFLTSASYFTSGKRTKKSLWDKAILEYYHRPIKDYINTFAKHLKLEKIEENTEDGEMPRILGMLFSKK